LSPSGSTVATLTLPSGSFLLWGKFSFSSDIAQSVNCQIVVGNPIDTSYVQTQAPLTVPLGEYQAMSLQGSVLLVSSSPATLVCYAETPSDVDILSASLMALQVGTLTQQ
jgi:hypothetical protein